MHDVNSDFKSFVLHYPFIFILVITIKRRTIQLFYYAIQDAVVYNSKYY